MIFLINLSFAILTFLVVHYVMSEVGANRGVAIAVGILMAVVIFIADFAAQMV